MRATISAFRWAVRTERAVRAGLLLAATAAAAACGGGGGDGGGPSDPTPTPTGTLEGRVLGPGDVGVPSAALTLTRSGAANRSATSGADGSYRFTSVETGSWTLSITPPNGFVLATGEAASRTVTVTTGTTTVPLRLDASGPPVTTGAINGVVRHLGAGVGAVTIALSGPGGATQNRQTDASGAFSATGLAAGAWTVTITPPGYFQLAAGQSATRSVTVTAGETSTVDVVLAPSASVGTSEIALEALAFAPNDIVVPPGTTIRWRNTQAIFHTITPEGHAAWTDTSLGNNGETFQVVFNTPGTYPYFCSPHRSQGMTGVIRVVAP